MFSKFFIERPRFAMVVCIVIALAGIISIFSLPVEQYPEVAPPQIRVSTSYRGADAETIANTLAAPLEEAVNGVQDMIYMSSTSSNNGEYSLSVTFETGTDPDMALVRVQNRVTQVQPQLPQEVVNEGINVQTSFSDNLGFLSLTSPNGTYDSMELMNYAYANIKNRLARVHGMGDVSVHGAKYSIRVWLDPNRISSLGLSINDVSAAIQSQNRQASIGSVGAAPGNSDSPLVYTLQAKGRLTGVSEFENIIVRTSSEGGLVKLKDVARIELGQESYNFNANLNGKASAMISISQTAGSNALNVMAGVREVMDQIERTLPEDMKLNLQYDSTEYVRETIKEILITLLLTFTLVVGVCYLFLQEWRTTLVPVIAIPVSLLGTFAALLAVGYTINILSLFGLVLVIGTVVDDAIVVVERVQFIMERDKCDAKTATVQAMQDVTGPMMATTLVFLAIFVPVAFLSGITGQIYKQFAVTIGFAVCFSLIVALTLSPAMCAHLLKETRPVKKGPLKWFNTALSKTTKGYVSGAIWIAHRKIMALGLFALMLCSCWYVYKVSPHAFIPDEDQGVVFMGIQLPEGATRPRTEAVVEPLVEEIMAMPGVDSVMNIYGFNMLGGRGENVASIICPLDSWGDRKSPETQIYAITAKMREIANKYPQAQINIVTPPAIQGLGMASGIDMKLESTVENDPVKLAEVTKQLIEKLMQAPEVNYAFSSFTADTPHLFVDIDRQKAELMEVPLSTIFSTLQTYFGSAYINDINIGTQVNRVMMQSDWQYRQNSDSIGNIFVKSSAGEQVPLQSLVSVRKTLAPRTLDRYNLYPTAGITIVLKQGYSTGQGISRVHEIAKDLLPDGYTYEWSGLTYQEEHAQGGIAMVLIIALIFAFLFLVAQYESWSTPVSVILSLPTAMLGALIGFRIMDIPVSVYGQLGILLLVGLASKNAILIVEFAKEQRELHELPLIQAAATAATERFRAVLMTAFTCVLGALPMLFASGAGAASRKAVGSTLFFGMNAATILGIFLIPALWVIFQSLRENVKKRIVIKR